MAEGTTRRPPWRKADALLAKRDGLDKALKLARYTAALVVACSSSGRGTPSVPVPQAKQVIRLASATHRSVLVVEAVRREGAVPITPPHAAQRDWIGRVERLDAGLGLVRKALRIGRYLDNVSCLLELRNDVARSSARVDYLGWFLTLAFQTADGVYLFLDQLQFLSKAKVVDKSSLDGTKKLAAVFELASYVCESALILSREGEGGDDGTQDAKEDRLRLIQNGVDAIQALNDLRGAKTHLGDPRLLASLGVISACLSMRSKWRKL